MIMNPMMMDPRMLKAMILAAIQLGVIPGPGEESYGPAREGAPTPMARGEGRAPRTGVPRQGRGAPKLGIPRDYGYSQTYGRRLRENRLRPNIPYYRLKPGFQETPITFWGKRFAGPDHYEVPGRPRRRTKEVQRSDRERVGR